MNFFDKAAEYTVLHGKLPHWRQDAVCYFVTFRTADSIPHAKLNEWLRDRDDWQTMHQLPSSGDQKAQYHRLFTSKLERWLDNSYGECLLAQKPIKDIVLGALKHFNNIRYNLVEYTISANHVHMLIEPIGNHQLSDIMKSIKSYTANEINKLLGRSGHFWQKEYFDHIVRNEDQFNKFLKYIRDHNNEPVGATSCRSEQYAVRQDDGPTDGPTKELVGATSCRSEQYAVRQDDGPTFTVRQDDGPTQ